MSSDTFVFHASVLAAQVLVESDIGTSMMYAL